MCRPTSDAVRSFRRVCQEAIKVFFRLPPTRHSPYAATTIQYLHSIVLAFGSSSTLLHDTRMCEWLFINVLVSIVVNNMYPVLYTTHNIQCESFYI